MKVVLVLLLGLMAVTSAFGSSCGTLERIKVKQQWAKAFGRGHDREFLGLALWRAMFNLEPKARDFFKRVGGDDIHSADFQAHSTRVLSGLDLCISVLDNQDVLDAELKHLQGQHKERGITANYFDTFGEVLFEILPAQLGRCFDKDAWHACFDVIKHGIQS
jgi:hemoglobin-like flavoprotein